jgi:acetyl-CoA C-acetyltransferase
LTRKAYIFDAIRTPRGRGRKDGALYQVPAIDLVVTLLKALQERNSLDTAEVNDVILGCVTPVGEQGADIARFAVLHAGWDVSVPGMQINRFCASGLETVNLAAMQVRAGWVDLVVAGGVESMSRVPMASDGGPHLADQAVRDNTSFVPQGISADLLATIEGFDREELDSYAARSQRRAARARDEGRFRSLVPVRDQHGTLILDRDEHIRPGTTVEVLSTLKPAFQAMGEMGFDAVALLKYPEVKNINHVHTAGSSSGIVDGATLVLVGSKEKGKALGLKPRARVISAALVGTEPTLMLIGPGPASRKALKDAGMTIRDVDLIEVNEAFAAVPLRFGREMELEGLDNVNVNGGAIALGHPLGATGAMLLGTALDELERQDKETALITLCAAAGMGIATIIERVIRTDQGKTVSGPLAP